MARIPHDHRMTVLLTPPQRRQLSALADVRGQSAAAVIRDAITAMYQMTWQAVPHCAIGDACRCPQLWPDLKPPEPPNDPLIV